MIWGRWTDDVPLLLIQCTQDRDGCPKIVNLGSSKTDLFYERKKYGFKRFVGLLDLNIHVFGCNLLGPLLTLLTGLGRHASTPYNTAGRGEQPKDGISGGIIGV